ncbi:hypothetical protein ACL1FJ_00700 [Corynebacterium striatum]
MGKLSWKLDKDGVAELLRQQYTPVLRDKAEAVADSVRAQVPEDVPVEVFDGVGRNKHPYSMVVIMHPSGIARQAKHGTLTRAAAQQGLKVRRYPLPEK